MSVAASPIEAKLPAHTARRRVEQMPFWPQVTITSEAGERLSYLEILYPAAAEAMRWTVCSIVEAIRSGETKGLVGFSQVPLMAMDDLPTDVTVVYQFSKDRLVIVDVRRPAQPALF